MANVGFLPVPLAATAKPRKPRENPPRISRTSIDRASFDMLRLYRTNLEVRFRCVDELSLQTENQKRTHAIVSETLKRWGETKATERELEWDEAYKVERMIDLLLGGTQLRQEIRIRLDELAAERASEAEHLRAEYEMLVAPSTGNPSPAADDALLRSFLLRVMEILHWYAKKKYLARPIRKEATKNILLCVIVAFLLVVAPYVAINFDFVPTDKLTRWWSLFALYTALVSGLLGAFFSRLIMLQRHGENMTFNEVFLQRELSYTLLRAGVGMCGALIVYFFLKSGIVDGALFPKFDKLAMEFVQVPDGTVPMTFVVPSKDLALLTVWCFLAGFSEILVPSILVGTERQFCDAATPKPRGAAK
jgi:hypothetical protein